MATRARNTDRADGVHQVITLDRKIPLTWLFGIAITLAALLGSMYYDIRRYGEKLTDVASNVQTIKEDNERNEKKANEDVYTMRDFQRRLTLVEATLQAQRDQQTKGGK